MTRPATAPLAVLSLTLLASFGSLATAAVLHDSAGGSPDSSRERTTAAQADSANSADEADSANSADEATGRAADVDLSSADLALASAPARLSPAASCDDLLEVLRTRAEELVGPWGWADHLIWQVAYAKDPVLRATPAPEASRTTAQSNTATGTNVQEVGVDEPDVAKTDDGLLVRIDHRMLTTYDVSGDKVRKLGSLRLPGSADQRELLLRGDRVLVVTVAWRRGNMHTRVTGVDLSAPAAPVIADVHEFEGRLLSARLTGDDVRLVVSSGLPRLDFVAPSRRQGERITRKQAKRENQRIVRESTIGDWLPEATDDGTASPLLDCTDVALPDQIGSPTMLNVIGFPFDTPTQRDTTAVVTDTEIAYTSADRLHLATSAWRSGFVPAGNAVRRAFVRYDTTDLHTFALSGTEATYLGSGRLDGTVSDRWAMDAVDGVLRVALAVPAHQDEETGKRVKRHNAVVTMRETGGGLEEVGRVDRLGVNEDIQSVRWFDDFAVLVTFRQVDPLYAIDLAAPDDPRLLGELKIPGFSSYLHPIGDDRLLGLGTDATRRGRSLGPQVSTFDVSNPAAPAQLAKTTYGKWAELRAASEPRQFTWLPDRSTALTPLWSYADTGLTMLALEVSDDGDLSEKRIPLRGAWRAAYDVRTLPLADGRVVVSSSRETRFLDW